MYASFELTAWFNEIDAVGSMVDVDVQWDDNHTSSDPVVGDSSALARRIIDPCDEKSPLVWLELRRHFIEKSS